MSALKLTADQMHELADVLKQLQEITADTGINFDAYGTWDIEYAGNRIRVRHAGESGYVVDNYCS